MPTSLQLDKPARQKKDSRICSQWGRRARKRADDPGHDQLGVFPRLLGPGEAIVRGLPCPCSSAPDFNEIDCHYRFTILWCCCPHFSTPACVSLDEGRELQPDTSERCHRQPPASRGLNGVGPHRFAAELVRQRSFGARQPQHHDEGKRQQCDAHRAEPWLLPGPQGVKRIERHVERQQKQRRRHETARAVLDRVEAVCAERWSASGRRRQITTNADAHSMKLSMPNPNSTTLPANSAAVTATTPSSTFQPTVRYSSLSPRPASADRSCDCEEHPLSRARAASLVICEGAPAAIVCSTWRRWYPIALRLGARDLHQRLATANKLIANDNHHRYCFPAVGSVESRSLGRSRTGVAATCCA